ncbi:uncharacterized protein LOC129563417 [Moschus berezovskii]|uniref:uncharacterized protein LOC129563417 n=1 Tax=Moschus berezovskii TaxID=68408 RepID=UPI00244412F9|nr:uncharacterized protein LOC129563417 [Moschus berezovskii]
MALSRWPDFTPRHGRHTCCYTVSLSLSHAQNPSLETLWHAVDDSKAPTPAPRLPAWNSTLGAAWSLLGRNDDVAEAKAGRCPPRLQVPGASCRPGRPQSPARCSQAWLRDHPSHRNLRQSSDPRERGQRGRAALPQCFSTTGRAHRQTAAGRTDCTIGPAPPDAAVWPEGELRRDWLRGAAPGRAARGAAAHPGRPARSPARGSRSGGAASLQAGHSAPFLQRQEHTASAELRCRAGDRRPRVPGRRAEAHRPRLRESRSLIPETFAECTLRLALHSECLRTACE